MRKLKTEQNTRAIERKIRYPANRVRCQSTLKLSIGRDEKKAVQRRIYI